MTNAPTPTPKEIICVLKAALERPYASAVLERRHSEAIILYLERLTELLRRQGLSADAPVPTFTLDNVT